MAIAATITVPLTSPTRRSLASVNFFRPSSQSILATPQRTFNYPNSRLVASSMSTVTPSSTSFLHSRESGSLHFAKYQGLGNNFILIDNRDSSEPKISSEKAVQLCDRNFGVGADGVIFILPGINGTDYTMRIFNSDGSEPEMCGNGVRCFAKFVSQLESLHGRHSFTIHTGAGRIIPEVLEDGNVKVDMGEPILKASDVPTKLSPNKDLAVVKSEIDVDGVIWNVTCVSMGNPHCVTFSRKETQNLLVDELELAEIGPKFEHHEMFPARTNTDRVFRSDCSTRQVYEEAAKEVALSVVSGINSSIFAYGQTSSGKTYTMSGITEYTVADIFNYIEKHTEREFVLKFSAIEIYNESVRDLLSPDCTPLRLLDDPERGTVVEKLTEETLRDWNHFAELISFCETQRQIGETTLNEASSRSHQILRLTVESSAREFLGNDKCSSLSASVNFVDLAGSERASQTNSAGTRLKEGCHINRSLLTLGTVIRKLSKGRNGHIPFRDSKLTRILQSSLGGNARTAIICTMSPARSHVEQTRNTLLFASCAKEVATNAQVNVVVSDKALVKQLQKELAKLESELRNSGSARPISDSATLLKEKDLEIEKLKKEVKELALQRDLAQSQIKDMLQGDGDNMSCLMGVESFGPRYPKLRVRNSWEYENRREEPNVLSVDCEESVRSFDASQYSDGHSISSDENLFQLPDLEKNLMVRSSPGLSVTSIDAVQNDLNQKNTEDQHEEEYCKEVRCIELEDPIANTHTYSNPADLRSHAYTDSDAASPCANTAMSGLIVVDNGDKNNMDLCSSGLKEDKRLDHLRRYFVLPSPKDSSPWLTESNRSSSRSLKLSRSRSCKASLMRNLSSDWFEDDDVIQNTPPIGNEKDFAGRPEGFLRKVHTLKYNANAERPSQNGHENSVENSAVDDVQNVKSYTDKESESNGPLTPKRKETENLKSLNLLTDHEFPGIGLDPIMSAKNVKDVGLDPMQADGEIHSDWPSKFKRLQKEIIELWDACNVSLVHRTYFFLLFKGDPSDSIYMEVELRRLSYLKQTFSQGNKTLEDGRTLTSESSTRYLRRERQMLCNQMQKRLSKSDRENLYLKWGLRLSSKHRRLQLAHRLWTDTNDMEHIRESAAIVAKLVGSVEPEQALKEMFGLNFAPRPTSRKSFSWTWTQSMK